MPDESFRQEPPTGAQFPDKVNFVGQPPPKFQQALKAIQQEKAELEGNIDRPQPPPKKQPQQQAQRPQPQPQAPQNEPHLSQARPQGSAQLEEILDILQKQQGHVFEELQLPSGGIFYDGRDGPTDGLLHIRPMTGEEEQILSTPRWVRKGQALNMIFRRCVKEMIHSENLLSVDRTYMLIWLRGISYGNEYEVEVKCPECDRKFNHTIDLGNLLVNYCPKDYRPPLVDTLPKSGLKVTYRLSRGRDESELQEYRDRNLKMFGDVGADDTLLYRTAMLVEDIGGLKDKHDLMILLKKLPIQDVAYMRNLTSEPPFGVDTRIEINCAGCMHDFEADLPLEANFFFPRRRRKKDESA